MSQHDLLFEVYAIVAQLQPVVSEGSPPPAVGGSPQIVSPGNGEKIGSKAVIRGVVTDHTSQVWVIVHPMGTGSYWVQPEVSKKGDGEWGVMAYFGRPGSIDTGKIYEVLAIVEPLVEMREGQIFDKWPDARLVSDAITVMRN